MDYLAGGLELAGVWTVGNRNRWGFIICLGCNVLWALVAIQTGVYGLLPVSVAMAAINVRNFVRWGRK